MATSLFLTSFFPYVLLSILFTSTIVKGEDLVTKVCVKTPDPSLCEKLLRLNPDSKTADLQTLGVIAFSLTSDLIVSTSDRVRSLRDNATNPKLKEQYSTCSSAYYATLMDRENGREFFMAKGYGQVNYFMTIALGNLRGCDKGFQSKFLDQDEKLKQASLSLQQYCFAIIVIGVLL
ncbi:pectinesterase inhibitor-like [Solanum dulcamara]|uniref:pectinesterase inhibitor-like n=1 Tax=Solanum dulcamara TaxID=45834 RepID=UPI002486C9A8|nr:pectinesterase inhibitor-like [Solanum dulcamara]